MDRKKLEIKRNVIKGAFYGLAIGDAMGATTEFMEPARIKELYGSEGVTGIIGDGWLGLKPGEVTDDTQMAICVAKAMLRSVYENGKPDMCTFLAYCRRNFLAWFASKPVDVGNQCSVVLSKFSSKSYSRCMAEEAINGDHIQYEYWNEKWFKAASSRHAKGNGSLMRALPAALVGLDYALDQGKLTHNNATCNLYLSMYYDVLRMIRCKYTKDEMAKAHPCKRPLNGGSVYETFEGAMYWFINTSNFYDCIKGVVNNGGDADTIGAVAGSIAGYYYGFDGIPGKLVNALSPEVMYEIDRIVDGYMHFLKY